MDYKSRIITYGELRKGFEVHNDKYGIATYEQEARRRAFLANPSGAEDDDMYMYIAFDGDVPVGRNMYFRTRLKVGDSIIYAYSGSGFEVVEQYRKEGVGGYIIGDELQMKGRNPGFGAGISDDAIPLFRRLKNTVFEYPRLMLLYDSKPLLSKMKLRGVLLSCISGCANLLLHGIYGIIRLFHRVPSGYSIRQVKTIPEWVDDIVLNDGHKYCEVHDKEWLQWCLDNKFTSDARDCQKFFAVYQEEKPVAFFMTKERYRDNLKGMKNVVLGTIVEWGNAMDCSLREIDLNMMALKTFSKGISIIQTSSNDEDTIHQLKRIGFVHHGYNRIMFKDRKKTYPDMYDESLWRIRYGYSDTILF